VSCLNFTHEVTIARAIASGLCPAPGSAQSDPRFPSEQNGRTYRDARPMGKVGQAVALSKQARLSKATNHNGYEQTTCRSPGMLAGLKVRARVTPWPIRVSRGMAASVRGRETNRPDGAASRAKTPPDFDRRQGVESTIRNQPIGLRKRVADCEQGSSPIGARALAERDSGARAGEATGSAPSRGAAASGRGSTRGT